MTVPRHTTVTSSRTPGKHPKLRNRSTRPSPSREIDMRHFSTPTYAWVARTIGMSAFRTPVALEALR